MTESMVERVAKAMWEKRREISRLDYEIELDEWGDGTVPAGCGVLDEARAAIEAMREPTEQMRDHGKGEHHHWDGRLAYRADIAVSIFNSMIDAALEEGKR